MLNLRAQSMLIYNDTFKDLLYSEFFKEGVSRGDILLSGVTGIDVLFILDLIYIFLLFSICKLTFLIFGTFIVKFVYSPLDHNCD